MLIALFALMTGPADAMPAPLPQVAVSKSVNFDIAPPRLKPKGDALRIEGAICRRANRSLLSPARIAIDHLSSSGAVLETIFAYVPPLSLREDQRCAHYGATLKTAFAPGETIRVGLPRSGRATATQPE